MSVNFYCYTLHTLQIETTCFHITCFVYDTATILQGHKTTMFFKNVASMQYKEGASWSQDARFVRCFYISFYWREARLQKFVPEGWNGLKYESYSPSKLHYYDRIHILEMEARGSMFSK